MSKIGRKPVVLPKGVSAEIKNGTITVKHDKNVLSMPLVDDIEVEIADGHISVSRANDEKPTKALHGMVRAMLHNMVVGVSEGYTKVLEIQGVGYRAAMQGKNLVLNLGFSHPVEITPPEGITFAVDGNTTIFVKGIDKQVVGQIASEIRSWRAPEPYKGKGIRYRGEYVRRKAGKTGSN
ncbi:MULTISPECIES: 50S ribosomal protein L6 [Jonquetella]|uniref:Large ribosomal subunit protein uL6 n=1 Tax=Jonquetella anthropi DSM 22815 TaxID=885272 RepID=H0UL89_9BACT|nr:MULTISPECIES: 50S ribosomal protein L6 [Jonquetella]EEX48010.1 ribosomal protein L6 [Jonquetella anthropi E3_33 E1]EHM13448.1 ribosomal protein L6, bacterial type [Jonquetella anthropi DSM 22815]ERL24326.1 ribosomal protein L6 [Jonquetella sp. BV3C21]